MKYDYKKLKKAPDRNSVIIQKCENKTVLHLGATDAPYTKFKFEKNLLLHLHIERVAKKVLGIDIDAESIAFLSKNGINNIEFFDMNNLGDLNIDADVIVFGEIIEHLENLNIAFDNLKKVMTEKTELIISTPNMFYIYNTIEILKNNHELVHPDHKLGFTYGTINQLLNSNGFEIVDFYFTFLPRSKEKFKKKLIKIFCKIKPSFSENLLVIAKLKNKSHEK